MHGPPWCRALVNVHGPPWCHALVNVHGPPWCRALVNVHGPPWCRALVNVHGPPCVMSAFVGAVNIIIYSCLIAVGVVNITICVQRGEGRRYLDHWGGW